MGTNTIKLLEDELKATKAKLQQVQQELDSAAGYFDNGGYFLTALYNLESLFQGLDRLDDAAGAQAGGPQGDEVLRVLQVGDAAGGLDLHMGGHMLLKQSNVLKVAALRHRFGGGRQADAQRDDERRHGEGTRTERRTDGARGCQTDQQRRQRHHCRGHRHGL